MPTGGDLSGIIDWVRSGIIEYGEEELVSMNFSRRYRVNVSRTSKGLKSYECTVEVTSDEVPEEVIRAAALSESDSLVVALDKKYPVEAVTT